MQSFWFVAVFAFLAQGAICNADYADQVKTDVDQLITLIPTGDSALGVPVLDPLSIESETVSISSNGLTIAGTFSDATLTGISDVVIESIVQSGDNVVVTLTIPTLTGVGAYVASGKVKYSFVSLPINGDGEITLAITNLGAVATLTLSEDSSNNLVLDDFAVDYTYDKLSIDLSDQNSIMNVAINALAPKVEKSLHSTIVAGVEPFVSAAITTYFTDLAASAAAAA